VVPATHAAAQAVHDAAFAVVLKVEPATQEVQTLLTLALHAVEA